MASKDKQSCWAECPEPMAYPVAIAEGKRERISGAKGVGDGGGVFRIKGGGETYKLPNLENLQILEKTADSILRTLREPAELLFDFNCDRCTHLSCFNNFQDSKEQMYMDPYEIEQEDII